MAELNIVCPVCGHAQAGEELRCSNCQFAHAFITHFAGERSHGFWEREVRAARRAWNDQRLPLLSASGAFALDWQRTAFLNVQTHVLTVMDSGFEEPARIEGVQHYSLGSHHSVVLSTNGMVQAEGDNDYGQCTVKDLKDIVFRGGGAPVYSGGGPARARPCAGSLRLPQPGGALGGDPVGGLRVLPCGGPAEGRTGPVCRRPPGPGSVP